MVNIRYNNKVDIKRTLIQWVHELIRRVDDINPSIKP